MSLRATFWSVITCMPACRSPPTISVMRPSLMPGVTATGHRRAVAQHPDLARAGRAGAGGGRRAVAAGMRGSRLA
jgi:hypothetical protein